MLKKMRWRFIGSAMGAFSAVIVLLAVVINLVNYHLVTKREDQVINGIFLYEEELSEDGNGRDPDEEDSIWDGEDSIWDEEEGSRDKDAEGEDSDPAFPIFEQPGEYQPEFEHTTRFFLICYDVNGNVEKVSTDFVASVTEEDALEMGRSVLNNKASAGAYKNYHYRVYGTAHGTTVIFLDISPEKQFTRNLMLSSVALVVVSLIIVFVLILLLSGRAIAPYVRNIERQKQFITDAEHELKTPLTSISASTDVLKVEYGEDEWITNIQKQTNRLSKLVANMITLSRLDEEERIPEKETFSLSEAAWETTEPFAAMAEAGHKAFHQSIEEDIRMVGNKAGIQQMLSVLLDNAVRYSDEKGEISLSVYQEHEKKILTVENSCDIDEGMDLDRLFDRFYRPDGSRSKKTGGFGIGLSIAQAIAQAHDGKIEVCIPEERRIRFTVTLR